MSKPIGESFQATGIGKGDHRYPPLLLLDLVVELAQLREMLLAVESTQVAEENQNRRTAQKPAGREDFAVDCQEVEIEVNLHRTIMWSFPG